MRKELLMGNEAIALGALRAGVRVVTGYPGTPSSEILETVAKRHDGSVYVEWSVNEKAAVEVAAGAAYSGARSMVTMKQVGLNVASDPLMNVNYVGVLGGMVIVVADDPGPISSQTEQDTRHFAKYAKLALFNPSTPEEAYTMIADAFDHSEKYGVPVLFRPTTRVCHSCATVEILEDLPKKEPGGFVKNSKWVIFPRLSYANHIKIEENLEKMREDFSGYEKNTLTGTGKKGIATGGVTYSYCREAFKGEDYKLLKISTVPFPDKLALKFLEGLDEVLVIEDLDPVIEEELIRLCGLHHLDVKILGKRTKHIQNAGEITIDDVIRQGDDSSFLRQMNRPSALRPSVLRPSALRPSALRPSALHPAALRPSVLRPSVLPVRPPVLCAGCPHRAAFFAVKEATKGISAVYTGDIGCYTLGNAQPLDMVDTCLCMGAGITIAQGLRRIGPDTVHFAFIGDSTFFHSGITGLLNAVYNQTDIVVVVLDNSTTAMTGNQPHPGTGVTMMGSNTGQISIAKIAEALGVSVLHRVNPLNQKAAKEAIRDVIGKKGVRVILFESPCIRISKSKACAAVDVEKCTGCKICLKKLGCPAISLDQGKARIDANLCEGCSLCASVCSAKAIRLGLRSSAGADKQAPTNGQVPSDAPRTKNTKCDILIAGVGGQGTVLASRLIASAAMKRGFNARTTETIGMAQRGGSVIGHTRIGDEIHSPMIPIGGADLLIAFEPAEAVRNLHYLAPRGMLIVCDNAIQPAAAALSDEPYEVGTMTGFLKENVPGAVIIDGKTLVEQCGKTLNTALLGAAAQSGALPFDAQALIEIIEEMPKHRQQNITSFELGRKIYGEYIREN